MSLKSVQDTTEPASPTRRAWQERFDQWLLKLKAMGPSHIPIAYKLALILTVLITSGMGLLGLMIVSNQTELLKNQINEFGHSMVAHLSESSQELVLSDDVLSLMVSVSNITENKSVVGSVIYSHRGQVIASDGKLPVHNLQTLYDKSTSDDNVTYTVEWSDYDEKGNEIEVISFITQIQHKEIVAGHALVTYSKKSLTRSLHDTISAITAATVFMILLGIITAYFLGKRISKPIYQLMDASKAIQTGDYAFQIAAQRKDEIGYLIGAFNKMANGLLEKSQVENAFSRFVSSNVAKQIMDNLDQIQLGGQRVEATTVFADIVGFTSLSEKLSAEEVALMLNEYFSYIDLACRLYHGTIDKYMGDCAMIVFGVPEKDPEHKFNAVACAILIQRLVERLNIERIKNNKEAIHFRIGVNSGEMLAGNMGSNDRMQYTVVGEAVNLAARLHSVADHGQVIVTDYFVKDKDVQWRVIAHRHKSIRLRGIENPVTTYVLTDLKPAYSAIIDQQIETILQDRHVA